MAINPLTTFDVALARRFDEYDAISTSLDGTDVLLIRNVQTGTTFKITVSALATFLNGALSESAILTALSAPNGVAKLDSGGKVPAAQLPAYVDDVLDTLQPPPSRPRGRPGKSMWHWTPT